MSRAAHGEPLVITLEEAMIRLGNEGCALTCRGDSLDYPGSKWLVIAPEARTIGHGRSWTEAVSAALNRPVVEQPPVIEREVKP